MSYITVVWIWSRVLWHSKQIRFAFAFVNRGKFLDENRHRCLILSHCLINKTHFYTAFHRLLRHSWWPRKWHLCRFYECDCNSAAFSLRCRLWRSREIEDLLRLCEKCGKRKTLAEGKGDILNFVPETFVQRLLRKLSWIMILCVLKLESCCMLKGAVSRYFCCFLVKTLQIQFPIAFTCVQHTSLSARRRSAINFYWKIYLRYHSGPKTRSVQTESWLENFGQLFQVLIHLHSCHPWQRETVKSLGAAI